MNILKLINIFLVLMVVSCSTAKIENADSAQEQVTEQVTDEHRSILYSDAPVVAEKPTRDTVRMPARVFGQAVSVRIKIQIQSTTMVLPMWIDLNEKQSWISQSELKGLGFKFPEGLYLFSWVEVGSVKVPRKVMKITPKNSTIAHLPEYPDSCCIGVLGQDFFDHGVLQVSTTSHSFVKWSMGGQVSQEDNAANNDVLFKNYKAHNFLDTRMISKTLLVGTQYEVGLDKKEIYSNDLKNIRHISSQYKKITSQYSLLFIPPDRDVVITNISQNVKNKIPNVLNLNKQRLVSIENKSADKYSKSEIDLMIVQQVLGLKNYNFEFKPR